MKTKPKRQYYPRKRTISLKNEFQRNRLIRQYAKNGLSVERIAEIFYTLSLKEIREIIDEKLD